MFSERLAKLRQDTKLSQTEIAKRLGMARTTYAGYENGSREPDLKTLNKLSEFFNVDLNWLITGGVRYEVPKNSIMSDKFDQLDESDQRNILALMESLLSKNKK